MPPPPPSQEHLSAEQAQLKAFLSQRQQERATVPSAVSQTTFSASPPPQPRPGPPPLGASTAQPAPPPPPPSSVGTYNKAAAARVQQAQNRHLHGQRPPPQRSQSVPRERTQGLVPGSTYGQAHEVSFAQANVRGLGLGPEPGPGQGAEQGQQAEGRQRSQSGQSFTSQGSQASQRSMPRYAQPTHTNMSRNEHPGAQQYVHDANTFASCHRLPNLEPPPPPPLPRDYIRTIDLAHVKSRYKRPMSPKPGGNRERSQSAGSDIGGSPGPNPSPSRQARQMTDARYDDEDECTFKPKIKALPSHYGRSKEQDG